MAVRAKRDVEAGLKKKGFRQDEGDHHWYTYWTEDGKKTPVHTKTSHGNTKDLGDHLIGQMSRQIGLTKAKFLDLVDCPLSREAYNEILVEQDCI